MASALFVYGTLMPGHLRWGILAPHARGQRPAEVEGTLYDTVQGWPSATFSSWPVDAVASEVPVAGVGRAVPTGTIPGWVIELDGATAATLLAQLDEIEGVAPDGAIEEAVLRNRYRRRRVRTVGGDEVWAYEAAWVGPAWVPIDRWGTQAEQ